MLYIFKIKRESRRERLSVNVNVIQIPDLLLLHYKVAMIFLSLNANSLDIGHHIMQTSIPSIGLKEKCIVLKCSQGL